MKVAIVGSRGIENPDIDKYLPASTTEIVSGGAKGVDTCARAYALKNGLILTEFLPEYSRYKKGAPLMRNLKIIDYADMVIAFWDGSSKGTRNMIEACKKEGKEIIVVIE